MPKSIAFVVLAALIVGAPPAWAFAMAHSALLDARERAYVLVGKPVSTFPGHALANPASVFCLKSGGRLEMRERLRGQYSVCILPNGRVVEEWKFFRENRGRLGGER